MERQSWCSHQSPVPIPLLFIILAATDTLLQVHRISLFHLFVGIAPSQFVATPDASAKPKGRPVTKQPSSYGSSTRLYNAMLRVLAFAKSSLAHLSVAIRLDIHRRKILQNSFSNSVRSLLDLRPGETIRFSRNKRHRLAEIHRSREQVTNVWNFWQNLIFASNVAIESFETNVLNANIFRANHVTEFYKETALTTRDPSTMYRRNATCRVFLLALAIEIRSIAEFSTR